MIISNNITEFFCDVLSDLECQPTTRAYIISIFGKYKTAESDLSKGSVTLLFAQARDKKDFSIYQNIGDFVFFTNALFPGHLKNASKDYYDTIARLSYYSCYNIVNKQWKLYKEMADQFLILENQVKTRLKNLK